MVSLRYVWVCGPDFGVVWGLVVVIVVWVCGPDFGVVLDLVGVLNSSLGLRT